MSKQLSKVESRQKKRSRIRSRVVGTSERPRISVFRSNTRLVVQLIDDSRGVTLVCADTTEKACAKSGRNLGAATAVGELVARRALELGIKSAVFDRSGYLYHGRVKALADSARAVGLKF